MIQTSGFYFVAPGRLLKSGESLCEDALAFYANFQQTSFCKVMTRSKAALVKQKNHLVTVHAFGRVFFFILMYDFCCRFIHYRA